MERNNGKLTVMVNDSNFTNNESWIQSAKTGRNGELTVNHSQRVKDGVSTTRVDSTVDSGGGPLVINGRENYGS